MIYHSTTGLDNRGFLRVFLKAIEIAKANGTKQVLLSVEALRNLNGVIVDALPNEYILSFRKNRRSDFDDVSVCLETRRTRSAFARGVAFAYFVSNRRLEEILKDYRVTDTVYIPWAPNDLIEHKASHPDSVQI